jgi:hypothetical protein
LQKDWTDHHQPESELSERVPQDQQDQASCRKVQPVLESFYLPDW